MIFSAHVSEVNGFDMEIDMADILIMLFVAVVVILLWVMIYDSNRFVLKQHRVTDKRIRKKVRAVVLADLHNKRYGKENERLLEAIKAQEPDFILIAGDLLNAMPQKSIEPAIQILTALARDYPIYYGNGNHEYRLKLYPEKYGNMAKEYGQALEELGIKPLVNSHAVLAESGLAIYGAEIDREFFKRFRVPNMPADYMSKILGQAQEELYTVLLAHNPDYFPQYAAWGADLVLAGHVHGGVARVPILDRGVISPGLWLFPKYDGGIYQEGKSTMVLSRGLGMHTIHVRLFNPAELWVVDFEPEE